MGVSKEGPYTDVEKADDRLRADPTLNHEYLPIAGLADFTDAAQKLILGAGSTAIKDKRVGSLHLLNESTSPDF